MARLYLDHEVTIVRRAIQAYLHGDALNTDQTWIMRAYLRDWAAEAEVMCAHIEQLTTTPAIDAWMTRARALGINPL